MVRCIVATVSLVCLLFLPLAQSDQQSKTDTGTPNWHAEGKTGAVCVGGSEARDASLAMLKSGGNAADAAVVATLIISVTDNVVCFGGEGPILYYDKKTESVEVYCGLGVAPRLATQEYFAKKGGIPNKGIESAAVPGLFDGLLTLLSRRGTKTFAEVAQPTLQILDQGHMPYHKDLAVTGRCEQGRPQGAAGRSGIDLQNTSRGGDGQSRWTSGIPGRWLTSRFVSRLNSSNVAFNFGFFSVRITIASPSRK